MVEGVGGWWGGGKGCARFKFRIWSRCCNAFAEAHTEQCNACIVMSQEFPRFQIFIFCFACLVYSNTLLAGFAFDDNFAVVRRCFHS